MSLNSFIDILKNDQALAIRLAFIDFKIFYTGVLSRTDITSEFDISEITATRIISKYKELREKNLYYDNKSKKFELNELEYQSLVDFSSEDALKMLSEGFDKNKFVRSRNIIRYENIDFIQSPLEKNKVAIITRAIFNKNKIKIKYNSTTSNNKENRILSPLVILFDGRNWIFRAYHEDSDTEIKYKNFNFSRIIEAEKTNESIDYNQTLDYDDLWNMNLPIELEINPNLKKQKKDEIKRDFGINSLDNKVLMTSRAAFVWIILNQWLVCYEKDIESDNHYNFILKNTDMLKSYKAI
ncbi:TPA: WYL domain-containing protein [Proteus mirabilis]|uniref:WYL domain-containing protein n=1 Tax=Proteus mirabilis TaxID=584 RepID=UPI0005059FB8|nr:WYL domain-containing protein [Proteus mirabilis]AUT93076.1 WYL domain-containing protein [Proteus mirabilis]AUU34032.1 WYL domain-containing protein [Proteus mirabilis]EKW0546532.1 WYL domain-containing protein [Proteus mirabilis]EKW4853014.1 WYL domain-containing protein [Proteus mirabilis]EKY0561376.1 WYL domain-containing protein [Proteus mirabilis]